MKIAYPARITKEEDGIFFVAFPDLEEAMTQGETLDEALFNAAEVLTLVMEHRLEQEQEIPEPSQLTSSDVHWVAPEVNVQAALLIRKARAGRPLADLARILDASWPSVKRLENPRSSPTLKMINKAAAALGKRLVLSFE